MSDVKSRLMALSTCQISDGLRAAGLSPVGLVGIAPLEPAVKFVGSAFTVVRSADEADLAKAMEYLGHVQPGDAIVIANSGRLDSSAWGGQRCLGAIQRGAAGTVIDGAYRDVEETRLHKYPVYGRARTVAGSVSGGGVVVAINETVTIGGCRVSPRDYVVGDGSGVIVVPRDATEDVLRAAETLAVQERELARLVKEGVDFLSARQQLRGGS